MSRTNHDIKEYDVVIVGGGLSGMSIACLLGKHGLRTACLDRLDPEKPAGSDLRTTAVSFGSRQVLEEADIWERIDSKACPIRNIQILDGQSPVLLNFLSSEVEDKSFGWILENEDIHTAQREQAEKLECLDHIAPCVVSDFSVHDNYVDVITDQGTLRGKLVIGADGRQSFTRKWMNIRTRSWSYRQRAVVCSVEHQHPHGNIAVEHFFPAGPFAILPMSDDQDGRHRSSVVFTEHGPQSRSLMKESDRAFESRLAGHFPQEYGQIKMITKRACYPIGLIHAAGYIGPRMALVADAAHGIHPIAGQGLNLGFRDIKELGRLIIEAHKAGDDIGGQTLLETYQRHRRPDNTAMIAVTDSLNRLFSNNIPPVRMLRRLGLKAVSKLPPAKRFFMRQAMGDRS